jgi:hypothetical protein
LAKQTVTIHQHLDGRVSIRSGPHVVGRYGSDGQPLQAEGKAKRRGKLEIQKQDSQFPTAPEACGSKEGTFLTRPRGRSKDKYNNEAA